MVKFFSKIFSPLSRRSKTFSFAAIFLPQPLRQPVKILYSFFRYVDDIADLSTDLSKSIEAITKIECDLRAGFSDDVIVSDLLSVVDEEDLKCVFDFIDGIKSDLGAVRIENNDQLYRYCYQVAGTVGVILGRKLNVSSRSGLRCAAALGVAMQLTNISRDVAEDFAMGRIYLPNSLISHDTVQAALACRDSIAEQAVLDAVLDLLDQSEPYYEQAGSAICLIRADCRVSIDIAMRLYRAINSAIRLSGKGFLYCRTGTTITEKLLIAATAVFQRSILCGSNFVPNKGNL